MTETYRVIAGKVTFVKDPNASLDYPVDFADWLGTDAIADHAVTVDGVTLDSSSVVGTWVIPWISGGTVGERGSATIRITTNSTPPRIDDRTIYFRIKNK